jgi:hypothetical protein
VAPHRLIRLAAAEFAFTRGAVCADASGWARLAFVPKPSADKENLL